MKKDEDLMVLEIVCIGCMVVIAFITIVAFLIELIKQFMP
jgi:hypothetical protein